MTDKQNPCIGGTLENSLKEDGIADEVTAVGRSLNVELV